MKTLNFSFSTKLTFDDYVHDHSFALRIIPPDTESQKIISCSLNISPSVITKQTVDAFGNNVTAGYIHSDHRFLDFDIKGTAEVDSSKHSTFLMPCYLYQSEFTAPDEKLIKFYSELKDNCIVKSLPTELYISAIFCPTLSSTKKALPQLRQLPLKPLQ